MKSNLRLLFILIALTVLAWAAYALGWADQKTTVGPLSDFAIEDTSLIDKIYIADMDGFEALLERQDDKTWTINNKWRATDYKIQNLMEGFQNIRLKGPVQSSAREGVTSMIATRGRRVDIYTQGNLSKTWYIGTCTPDHFGTYMVLENGDGNRSTEPMITHMDGFTGCLRQRYFAWEKEWRHTGMFNYAELAFSQVDVVNYESPSSSFTVHFGGKNDISLHSPVIGGPVERFDTLAVKDYLLLYKKVHCETFVSYLNPTQEDSLRNTIPAYTLRVTGNDGNIKKLDLYWKTPDTVSMDAEGNPVTRDPDRMHAVTATGEVVTVQRYTFDPLLMPIVQFAPRVQ